MLRRFTTIALATLLGGGAALADFTFEQTSKMTGGTMMSMVKVMGTFSKQLREPMKSTTYVKGDRMAMYTAQNSATVTDLQSETITEINFEKKTYSVVTFAQMAEALRSAEAKLKDEKGKEHGEYTIKLKVDPTNETRQVNGLNTKKAILQVEFIGTDKETGKTGTIMTMVSDMWLAQGIAGYDEVNRFHQRMAQKLAWAPGAGMLSAMAPGSNKGMAELIKEGSKLQGVPVLQLMKMMFGTPEQAAAAAQQQQAQQPQQQEQSAEAEKPTVGGAIGRLGGRLGGLGGFGRKKKQEEPAQQQPQQAQGGGGQQQAQPQSTPGSFMEMTTELSAFAQGPVDASKFEVPAGFKQVESQTLKTMKR